MSCIWHFVERKTSLCAPSPHDAGGCEAALVSLPVVRHQELPTAGVRLEPLHPVLCHILDGHGRPVPTQNVVQSADADDSVGGVLDHLRQVPSWSRPRDWSPFWLAEQS